MRPRRATGRGGSAGRRRSVRRASPIPSARAAARRAANRARARRGSSSRASDRGTASRTRSLSSRIASESCTIESGCRPPSFSEMPIEPRVTVMRSPSFSASSTSMSIALFEARRKEVVVVGRRRAAGQEKFDQRHADGDAERLGRHAVPDALHRHEPGNELLPEAGRMGAGQRLVEVMVRVDQTRQDDVARGVEGRSPRLDRRFAVRNAFDDLRPLDDDPALARPARGLRAGP